MRKLGLFIVAVIIHLSLVSNVIHAQDLPRRSIFGSAVAAGDEGVTITSINPGTPAASAGLRVGDVLTEIGPDRVSSPIEFIRAVHAVRPLTRITVSFLRSGKLEHVEMQLLPAPKESDPDVLTEYDSIDVDGSLRRVLITMPKVNHGRLPAMLFIGGIGCYTVDNPADPDDPYRFLARDLSRAGIIVMRVEKSGIGDSQGGPCFDTDFNEESKAYGIALEALFSNPSVNPTQVFLFGHSIGTLIAPRLAASKPVAGIIVAEAVGVNWFEYELANLRRQSVLGGDSPSETDALLQSKEMCMHQLLIERNSEAAIEVQMPACKSRNTYPVTATYMQQISALNIADAWTRINMPVLAIYGTADFVTAEGDHQRIVDIVNGVHPSSAQLITITGMDHHLESMETAQHAYDLRVKQHGQGPYAQQLSTVVRTWICAHVTCLASG